MNLKIVIRRFKKDVVVNSLTIMTHEYKTIIKYVISF